MPLLSRQTMTRHRLRLFSLAVIAVAPLIALALSASPARCAEIREPTQQGMELPGVRIMPDEGRWHLDPGEKWEYRNVPPTSGPHDPKWVAPGFYKHPQPPEKLVHSLEHGDIVIYYGKPGPEAIKTLKNWARHFTGKYDGVIVTPLPDLDKTVILTAWRRLLRLDAFDEKKAKAFLTTFRGRGPESEGHED
jgi:uncharacterized protein DUF3105